MSEEVKNNRNYVMVRAMSSQEEHFREFFDNSIVAVGWANIDFSKCSDSNELSKEVRKEYYQNQYSSSISKKINSCLRFNKIKKDDFIIVPYYSSIALAIAEGEKEYKDDDKTRELDLVNRHKVKYLRENDNTIITVARSDLSEGLQRRLRVMGSSVSDLSEFSEEIDKLFNNSGSYSYSGEAIKKDEEMREDFKEKLLRKIQEGKTNLQTGGIGMENLVKELFECEGYEAKIESKRACQEGADADISAWRDDSFSSVKYFIQVKHHSGESGDEGIKQIINAINEKNQNGEDCIGIFITSGTISPDNIKYAEEKNIVTIDGNKLMDIIFNNINKLSDSTLCKLGISKVPRIIEI